MPLSENLIVGSTALAAYGLNRRPPADLDMWGTAVKPPKEIYGDRKVDWFQAPEHIMKMVRTQDGIARADDVYTMKCSHLAYNIHWDKTKNDILFLKAHGCKINVDLFHALKELWKKEHGSKDFLSLDKTKQEFFTDSVTYVYDHDYLHEVAAYPNKPVYSRVLKEGHEVLIDKNKFDYLPYRDKVKMFREEMTVIATERWLVNPKWVNTISWYRAWFLSLQKTITSLTKNWAADFIVLNLEQFVKPQWQDFEPMFNTLKELKR